MTMGKLAGLDVPQFWLSENKEVFIISVLISIPRVGHTWASKT